jgi:hypothetical protein
MAKTEMARCGMKQGRIVGLSLTGAQNVRAQLDIAPGGEMEGHVVTTGPCCPLSMNRCLLYAAWYSAIQNQLPAVSEQD